MPKTKKISNMMAMFVLYVICGIAALGVISGILLFIVDMGDSMKEMTKDPKSTVIAVMAIGMMAGILYILSKISGK